MTLTVRSVQAGTAHLLDLLGPVSGLQFTSALPDGDTACQFTLGIPADANPPGLTAGSLLTVMDGPVPVWSGVLADAQRGNPWQITGQGLSSLSARYVCLDSSGNPTTDPATAVNAAIARGLPWANLITLQPAPTGLTVTATDVGSLLDATSTAASMYWGVNQWGQLFQTAYPTTPTLLMVASNTLGDRTVDQYATDEYVRYTTQVSAYGSSISGPPATTPAPNNPAATAPRPYGRWERLDDITSAGPITAAAAQAYGNGQLALLQPRATFSGTLTVQPGDLRTLGGTAVRLSQVRAGQLVKVIGVQPDPALAELIFSLAVQVPIGTWTYDADSNTAQMQALGAPQRPTLAVPTASTAPPAGQLFQGKGWPAPGIPPHLAPR